MITKKKITRMSLDELAKEMPILHEYEMQLMVGGIEFRDLSGNFIQKVGFSSEVRYIDLMDNGVLGAINNLESSPNIDNAASSIGRSWDNINSAVKRDIISTMISSDSNRFRRLNTRVVSSAKLASGAVMAVSNDGRLFINTEQLRNFTYNELLSILDHEESHLVANGSGTGYVMSTNEHNAYSGQASAPGFRGMNYWFRLYTANLWWGNKGDNNITKHAIAEACGVNKDDMDN